MTDLLVDVDVVPGDVQVNVEVLETEPEIEVNVGIDPPTFTIIDVLPTGPRGPRGTDGVDGVDGVDGAEGPPGPQGEPGSGTASYIHIQDIPLAVWPIQHDLGYYPNITAVDSLQREVVGDIRYVDTNNIEVTFSASFSGKAFLS